MIYKSACLRDERVTDYPAPRRIVFRGRAPGGTFCPDRFPDQPSTAARPELRIAPGDWIMLDFGCEIHGGIEIMTGGFPEKDSLLLISFGESFSEPFSHPDYGHTLQEITLRLTPYAVQSCGELGFRFVKLENCSAHSVAIQGVRAKLIHREFPRRAAFTCSDPLLNQIWECSVRTLELCFQTCIWDGIKRDRMVWMGDLFGEIRAAAAVFGHHPLTEKSLDFLRDETGLPHMMNGCATYSVWWILAQSFQFRRFGSLEYLQTQKSYLMELLELFAEMVRENGEVSFSGGYLLLDWATGVRKEDAEAIRAGCHALLLLAFRAGGALCRLLGAQDTAEKCCECAARMTRHIPPLTHSTAGNALQVFAGFRDPETVYQQCYVSRLPRGLSTFLGCFPLDVCAMSGHRNKALDHLRAYWGGMISLGATTFWEHFDVEWLENAAGIDAPVPAGKRDVHAECGDGCYRGFRNSLCHGWAAAPADWLVRNLCGLVFEDASTVRFRPDLCDLDFLEYSVPAQEGMIQIHVSRKGAEIELPPGIHLAENGAGPVFFFP